MKKDKTTPTPGPWEIEMGEEYRIASRLGTILLIGDGRRLIPTNADGRLIAAAPELFEALKAVYGLVESGQLVRDVSRDSESGWAIKQIGLVKSLEQARAAILKAEGGAK